MIATPDFGRFTLAENIAIFVVASFAVWAAGARVVRYVDAIADKTRLGQAFAGMLLLGGIASLPEIAVVSTAAGIGNASLSISNLLGSLTMNLVLLAVADAAFCRNAITSVVPGAATLLQGTLSILALALVAGIIAVGDLPVFGVGAGSVILFVFVIFAFWLSARYAKHNPWRAERSMSDRPRAEIPLPHVLTELDSKPLAWLWNVTCFFGAVILAAGFALAQSANAISMQTGLGSSFIGLVFVGLAAALPNFSSIVGAVRMQRFEMAISDVFGANLFEVALILLADVVFAGGAILNHAGRFEIAAALLGIVLTSIYLIGLLEREDRTILRMGLDSFAVFLVYFAGLALLYSLA